MMYGDDGSSKVERMTKAKKHNKARQQKRTKRVKVHGGVPLRGTRSNVLEQAAIDHLPGRIYSLPLAAFEREHLASPGRIYSLPLAAFERVQDHAPAELTPLTPKMNLQLVNGSENPARQLMLHAQREDTMGHSYEDDGMEQTVPSENSRLVFSIVEARPSKSRLIPIPAGASARLGPNDMLIAIHTDYESGAPGPDSERGIFSVSPSRVAQNPICVLSRVGSHLESLVDDLQQWRVRSDIQYTLVGLPYDADMTALITRLVVNRAVPGTSVTLASPRGDHDEDARLHRLAMLGYASLVSHDHAFSQWRLSDAGARALQPCRAMHSPSPVLEDRDVPIRDKTSWELHLALEDAGWTWEQNAASRLPAYKVGDEKLYTTRSKHLVLAYARCLLMAEELTDAHEGTLAIEHGQRKSYYKKILKGQKPKVLLALPPVSADY